MMNHQARLFFGLSLPKEARRALRAAAEGLRYVKGALCPTANYHLTLIFLGMTDNELIPRLLNRARGALDAPLTLSLDGTIGTFKGGSVVWAGLQPSAALYEARARLVNSLRTMGWPDLEDEFTPHITLGRGMRLSEEPPGVAPVTFTVDRVTLFESRREDGELRYVPLSEART